MGVFQAPRSAPTGWATLQVTHLHDGARSLLKLSGEADIDTEAVLRDALAVSVARNGAGLVVDVSELRFCDVQSAHLIRTAGEPAPVSLVGAARSVKRVFDLLECWDHDHAPHDAPGALVAAAEHELTEQETA